jgi:hypothetical protein
MEAPAGHSSIRTYDVHGCGRCNQCAYPFIGLGGQGRCPECGTRFDLTPPPRSRERPHIGPCRTISQLWGRFGPTLRTIAIVLLLLGTAALLVSMGWIAYAKLELKLSSW